MRITIDGRTLMERNFSGVSEYTFNITEKILEIDKKNQYCLFYNSFKRPNFSFKDLQAENVCFKKTSFPNKIFNWPLQKILSLPKIDKLTEADVFFEPNWCPVAVSDKSMKIITVHDLSFLRFREFFSYKRQAWHYILRIKKMLAGFDFIIAVSENTKRDLVDICGIGEEKIKTIYPGVEDFYKSGESSPEEILRVKQKYNLPNNFILFLGTIEPRKNIDGLIRAYNRLRGDKKFKNYKLVIAGGYGWKWGATIKEQKKSPFAGDIKFLGYVDKSDKKALYESARVFVYPSFYEGFGFPVLEAMACSVPVITSAASSTVEVAGSAGLLVDPYNELDLRSAMAEVLADSGLNKRLSQSGKKRAQKFCWTESARKTLSLFES